MLRRFVFVGLLLATAADADTVYKCIDSDGKVQFTDGRCPRGNRAQVVDLSQSRLSGPSPSRSASSSRYSVETQARAMELDRLRRHGKLPGGSAYRSAPSSEPPDVADIDRQLKALDDKERRLRELFGNSSNSIRQRF
ncbi:DUF4124 domain-containing protein [Thiohalocapsa marina]|uniref:DUF4124 domain-containing protein n=1 Tax=Thiohalocapsa marina TaxID=424902 RepID=A0A5M8FHM2_9GAMM|nr:DUF4124 domain-containing protein [Thiohalocapsa marina]KAA6182591.1 DUF4124 domain-containing protein [Thiohalocapsa marina]